jgi:DNA processing protein
MPTTHEKALSLSTLLLAAAYLHIPNRRICALAHGQDRDLDEWIAVDSSRKVAHARHLAREAIARLARIDAKIIPIGDAAYPAGLLDLDDPPAFLCVRGTLPQDGIAIVGSRTPPPEAAQFAHDLATACGTPVVSGLARGIDAAAHRGALDAKVATIAYVGTGIGATYPPEHHGLEEAIIAHGGAIASERLPDEPVTRPALVHRDRLQAAHARAVVLISSEVDGGAMQTMRFARELDRPRFALEPRSLTEYAGNARAIADGAIKLPRRLDAALVQIRSNSRSDRFAKRR